MNQSRRKKINVDQMNTEENKFTKISLFSGGLDGKLGATETTLTQNSLCLIPALFQVCLS